MTRARFDKPATLAMLAVVTLIPLLVSMISRAPYGDLTKGGLMGSLIGVSVLALVLFTGRTSERRQSN